MSDPFIGEIQIYAFDFAPNQWAICNGALVPIQQNTTLYSLLGVNYGGNGTSTFGIPNLQAQAACAVGQGPGLTQRPLGSTFGTEQVSLLSSEMPMHHHRANIYNQRHVTDRQGAPQPGAGIVAPAAILPFTTTATPNGTFTPMMLGIDGSSAAHPNQQPYLVLNFCISLQGTYPQRP